MPIPADVCLSLHIKQKVLRNKEILCVVITELFNRLKYYYFYFSIYFPVDDAQSYSKTCIFAKR